MEQARYWMWAKRKPDLNPHNILTPSAAAMNSYGDSWEEQAFAEDAAGTLGGCVWPPRSYSCSFCRREFRSAQALGGHMNVHRRDRARLKQSPIPAPADVVVPQNNHSLNGYTSPFDAPILYPSHTSTFLYNNHNPNPEFSSVPFSHVIRVSSPPPAKVINGDDQDKNISTLSFFSSVVQRNDKGNIVLSAGDPPSWSSFVAGKKRDRDSLDLIKKEEKKSTAVVESDQESRAEKEDCVTEDLETNLNLVVCQRQTNDDEQVTSCKRRKIEVKPLSFLPKLSAVDRCVPQSEVLKLCNSVSSEEVDLELRLGDAPKVK